MVAANPATQTSAVEVPPEVVEAMAEVGIDISAERSKWLTVEMQLQANRAITLGCKGAAPHVPTRVENRDIPDPHGESAKRIRQIRDLIEVEVKISSTIASTPSVRTPRRPGTSPAQLQRLLSAEFADSHPPEEVPSFC